jgi:hypothetical protein
VRTDVDASGFQQTRVPLFGRLQRAALVVRPDRIRLVFPPYWGRVEGFPFPINRLNQPGSSLSGLPPCPPTSTGQPRRPSPELSGRGAGVVVGYRGSAQIHDATR